MEDTTLHHDTSDRRGKPRLSKPFPAVIQWVDKSDRYQVKTVVNNLSASGLYLRLPMVVKPGTTLAVSIEFTEGSSISDTATFPHAALQATVLRSEILTDGTCGVAMRIERYKLELCRHTKSW